MQLHELPSIKNSKRKRVGRGPGSNWGQTCGRGQKGQKSRAGYSTKRGFEGGQMAISRRLPKFGFKPLNKIISRPLNLAFLESNERIVSGDTVNRSKLEELGFIKKDSIPVKLLAEGKLTKKLTIEVELASEAAIEKVQAAGGTVTIG